ncbi:TetR/AcrR family transcriptional regulator [Pedobacter paludis]|uniref:HTH tetR-type domain-containing protein n=1 Tax=Pedobacter paludis TaxID=2203212 RepID=A0A317F2K5_9SPHI|nr:TetR/AcrR family transcriptional regulator [Pedobacter paludis]PWS33351.1 hypothetical protein DF947_01620 [Pedobacter paludis]
MKKRGRGRPRKQDAMESRELLLRAVGAIMREEGYTGLGVTKVSARAGVDKKMIYWYYQNFENLVKTYIKEKDFWTPVFKKVGKLRSPEKEVICEFLMKVFKEQFRYFLAEKEMQEFIHWQVSESSQMLKEVSEEREFQGAAIAKLTDTFFEGVDVNLRAVLSIVLGGIYYVTWHADKNGSSVCGIDINKARDREAFERTIGQIIGWAFDKAG